MAIFACVLRSNVAARLANGCNAVVARNAGDIAALAVVECNVPIRARGMAGFACLGCRNMGLRVFCRQQATTCGSGAVVTRDARASDELMIKVGCRPGCGDVAITAIRSIQKTEVILRQTARLCTIMAAIAACRTDVGVVECSRSPRGGAVAAFAIIPGGDVVRGLARQLSLARGLRAIVTGKAGGDRHLIVVESLGWHK